MVKGTGLGPRGRMVFVGISDANVDQLKQGQPLVLDLAELVGIRGEIVIFHGRDEAAMEAEVRALGMITPDTKVRHSMDGDQVTSSGDRLQESTAVREASS
jgi:hypothetical protein